MYYMATTVSPLAPPAYVVGIVTHLPRTDPISIERQGRRETYEPQDPRLYPDRDLPHPLHARGIRFDPK